MITWFGSAAITSITARHPSYPLGSLNGSDDSMRLNGGTNSQPSHPYTAPEPEFGGQWRNGTLADITKAEGVPEWHP